MRQLSQADNAIAASDNQQGLAAELGIASTGVSLNQLVALIDARLGEQAQLESTRWFVMSVLRYLTGGKWQHPDDSGYAREQQYALATVCLENPEFSASIRTVLKGDSCRYVLVEFRRTRNAAKRTLATTTVAYRIAAAVVAEALTRSEPASTENTTANLRRASRRGYAAENNAPSTGMSPHQETATGAADRRMSPQEYAELEQALTQHEAGNSGRQSAHIGFGSDESRSWLFGALAGLALFAVVLFVWL